MPRRAEARARVGLLRGRDANRAGRDDDGRAKPGLPRVLRGLGSGSTRRRWDPPKGGFHFGDLTPHFPFATVPLVAPNPDRKAVMTKKDFELIASVLRAEAEKMPMDSTLYQS